jgi:hypothetical protein
MICQKAQFRVDQSSKHHRYLLKPPAVKSKIVKFSHRPLPLHLKQFLFEQRGCEPLTSRGAESLRPWWFDEQDKLLR